MFLSSIPVETGDNPNRPRPGRLWVSNPYRVHQRLSMALDGAPDDRVLFRIEGPIMTSRGLRPRVLVQSLNEPRWDAAFGNAPFLVIGAEIRTKKVGREFRTGERLHFLLRANPTLKREGRRLGIMSPEGQRAWLQRKAEGGGFALAETVIRSVGWQRSRRSRQIDPEPHVHLAVVFEGTLEVTDTANFAKTLRSGIGPAKGYGFGLLSVAPV